MQHKHRQFGQGFRIVLGDRSSQAAQMTLAPGAKEAAPTTDIEVLTSGFYVVSGIGEAIVNGRRIRLLDGTLLLIQRGDTHEIRNTGRQPLRTLNVYVPPAYTDKGGELPAGRP